MNTPENIIPREPQSAFYEEVHRREEEQQYADILDSYLNSIFYDEVLGG